MKDSLDQILRKGLGMMERQAGQLECEICGFGGVSSPATRRVLGKDACDQCAAELEGSLQIGPAIWMVSARNPWPDTQPAPDDPAADYGTVDYGDFTLGYRDREAAESYARQAGAEAREGFLVEVVGGDVGDALEAAGIADGAGFDGPAGVVWPHDDEEGLRRRLLYGADA